MIRYLNDEAMDWVRIGVTRQEYEKYSQLFGLNC